MNEPDHLHVWGPVRRRDFCHYVKRERACRECPEVKDIEWEARDFDADPLQICFADPDCHRCRQLLVGREPDSWKATASGGMTDAEPPS